MRWRNRDWPERPPLPKVAKLPREALEQLHARAEKFVEKSIVLGDLIETVQLARGRLYALRDGEWGCYTIRPNASETISSAEKWLDKRDWNDWG